MGSFGMTNRLLAGALLLGIAAMGQPVFAKTKLAVMTIEDKTRRLDATLIDGLTDALRTRIATSAKFIVIDKSRQADALKRLVRAQKKASYKACYNSSCQIPLGQALAADTILRTKVTMVGSFFVLNAELVDLAKEAVTGGAQATIASRPRKARDDRLLGGVRLIATQLVGGTGGGGSGLSTEYAAELRRRRDAQRQQLDYQRRAQLAQTAAARERARRFARSYAAQRSPSTSSTSSRSRSVGRRSKQYTTRRTGHRWQSDLSRRRKRYWIYGLTTAVTAALCAGGAALRWTTGISTAEEKAKQATTSDALKVAAEEADDARLQGILFAGFGAAAAGAALYFFLMMPAEQPTERSVALDRLPRTGPIDGGWAVTWGGQF